jgi:hypothetical protein
MKIYIIKEPTENDFSYIEDLISYFNLEIVEDIKQADILFFQPYYDYGNYNNVHTI